MRCTIVILCLVSVIAVRGQDLGQLGKNKKPKITGQKAISTNEEQSFTIELQDLEVRDEDDWFYPLGFSMKIYPGDNYSLNDNTITPKLNFTGTLSVPVRVNDGEDDSDKYNVKVEVRPINDPPKITGQLPLMTSSGKPFTLLLSYLTVQDPDDSYPSGFTLDLLPPSSEDYSVSGNQVTPATGFTGTLSVPVRVHDGEAYSEPYSLKIDVTNAANDAPQLTRLEEDPLIYVIGRKPVQITKTAEITDIDNDSLAWVEIGIAGDQYLPETDLLEFKNTSQIRGMFDVFRGTLKLEGPAPIADFVSAIRSVQYSYRMALEGEAPNRSLYIILNDGRLSSMPAQRQIKLIEVIVDLDIPTAFTPNGDSANDTWSIKPLKQSEELDNAVIRVYNKGGQLVFEGHGFEKEWDGRMNGELLPSDTYYYTIDLNFSYTKTFFKGLITILR